MLRAMFFPMSHKYHQKRLGYLEEVYAVADRLDQVEGMLSRAKGINDLRRIFDLVKDSERQLRQLQEFYEITLQGSGMLHGLLWGEQINTGIVLIAKVTRRAMMLKNRLLALPVVVER